MRLLMSIICVVLVLGLLSACIANENEDLSLSDLLIKSMNEVNKNTSAKHIIPITISTEAALKGAVCLDGSPPAYHWDRGFGSGANNWIVNLEGGGWCNDLISCVSRKSIFRGSSLHMQKKITFGGILSNKAEENPDFFNWNRVKIRYCDGASFAGNGENEASGLQFRGQRIYSALVEELMSKGMRHAKQALLSGCSAGGLATILHCDEFAKLFQSGVKVKCFADAGLFLDAVDVGGGHTMRDFFGGVVGMQGVENNLPSTCTNHLDATSCFFPENIISNITTPTFLLNAAYDIWQVHQSLMPFKADPKKIWADCKKDYRKCSSSQIKFLQDFRNHMLDAVKRFSLSDQNGLFINSCFTHCQSELQDTWFAKGSPRINNKGIAESVGDWYFDRATSKAVDYPYPCDKTCHNIIQKM